MSTGCCMETNLAINFIYLKRKKKEKKKKRLEWEREPKHKRLLKTENKMRVDGGWEGGEGG